MHPLTARLSRVASLAALLISATVTAAPQYGKKITPGDAAPSLTSTSATWVQGQAPDLSDGVTVVQFWATWSKPCQRVIPVLNRMHKSQARNGLKIVGVASDEGEGSVDDKVSRVRKFLKSKGDGMSYAVVVDPSTELKRQWMQAAGLEGLPSVFVVGRSGRVLWFGRPSDDRFNEVVELAIKNKYDPKLTPKGFEAREAARRAANLRNWREAYQHLDKAVEVDPPLFGWLVVERYKMTLEQEKNPEAAKAYLETILPAIAQDMYALDLVITAICKDPAIGTRDLDTAMVYAQQLKRAAGPNSAGALADEALVFATKGDIDQAVEIQTTAWLVADPAEKPEMKRRLDEYQSIKARKEQAKVLLDE